MSNEDVIKAIAWFQSLPFFHPLTCGNDSRHELLVGEVHEDKIRLRCPDCDYRQTFVPGHVVQMWQENKDKKIGFMGFE